MSKHKTRQIARIIEATLKLIHADGLSRLSFSSIAETAGVTRQTVYNYFPDVESIIAQALDAHSEAMEQHLLEIIQTTKGTREKLRAFAQFQISMASPEHNNISLEAGLSAEVRARLSGHKNAIKAALKRAIALGTKNKELSKNLEPVIASELVWGLVQGAVDAATIHPDQKSSLLGAVDRAIWAALRD